MPIQFLCGERLASGKQGQKIGRWLSMRWTGGHFVDDMRELKTVLETNCPGGPRGNLMCMSIGDHGTAPHPSEAVRKQIQKEFAALLPYFQDVYMVVLADGLKASLEFTMFSMVATVMNVGRKGGRVHTERTVQAALTKLEAQKGDDADFQRFVTSSVNSLVITADEFSLWMQSRKK